MSNIGESRVSIPNNVRKTIQNIKDITSNHSEEDIYAMLKDCSMDPNETAQRLLHLDSFHEVKRKRDKRKENVKSKPAEESRGKPGYQGRGTRGARGNSYSQYSSYDSGGRRNAAIWKENGAGESKEKGLRQSPLPVSKETDSIQLLNVEKSSSITMNGLVKVPNGSLGSGHDAQSSPVGDTYLAKANIDGNAVNSSSMLKGSSKHAPSASDPVLVISHDVRIPAAVGAVKCELEVQVQKISAETSEPIPTDRGVGPTETISNSHLHKQEPQNVDRSEMSSPMIEKEAVNNFNVAQQKILGPCPAAEKIHPPDSISVVQSSLPRGIGPFGGVEEATSKIEKLKFSDGQHVIIPNHIQVSDAIKNVLSFGSLVASSTVTENYANNESNKTSNLAADSAHDETAIKPSSCDQDTLPPLPEGNYVDQPQTPAHLPGKNLASEPIVSSFAAVPNDDKLKEGTLSVVGPMFPVVQTTPSYSFGFMLPMLVNSLVPSEGFGSQAHVSSSLSGSSPVMSTSSSTLLPPRSLCPAAVSPQPIALFRQPYPPNYVPYSHYSPIYVPPTMHQYFGHTTFAPPLPPGNVYLPTPVRMKVSPEPYRPGANTGNQDPVMVPFGYSPNASVTSGTSSTSEDLLPSVLKESNVYPRQQREGSAVWFPAAGSDTANFPLNSFLNLHPQAQHVITPFYHTLRPMATQAPGLTLLQQSQTTAGSIKSVGPPFNAYQQPQHQLQVNCNM